MENGELTYALQQMQAILQHPQADAGRRARNHFNMGCVLDELKQPLDAIVCMSAVLALDQDDHHARYYRAHLYSQIGDRARARQVSLSSQCVKLLNQLAAILPPLARLWASMLYKSGQTHLVCFSVLHMPKAMDRQLSSPLCSLWV